MINSVYLKNKMKVIIRNMHLPNNYILLNQACPSERDSYLIAHTPS